MSTAVKGNGFALKKNMNNEVQCSHSVDYFLIFFLFFFFEMYFSYQGTLPPPPIPEPTSQYLFSLLTRRPLRPDLSTTRRVSKTIYSRGPEGFP